MLVVGDVMLDRYWHGDTGRISPEAPVPVVRINGIEERVGGAANVALNLAALEANALLLGVTGKDEHARRLGELLKDANVDCRFEESPSHPTITKLRVISRNQQLIRLDFEEPLNVENAFNPDSFMARYKEALESTKVVILSDYAKGTLSTTPDLIRVAREAGCHVLVDPKGSDFSQYKGASLLTPNLSEFEAVVGACADEAELVERAEKLRADLQLDALLVTRSEQGMTLVQPDQAALHLPTEAREVFDVTGAGDTVIALLGAGLGAGLDFAKSAALANLGAGVVVGKLGTATVSLSELRRAARARHQDERGIMDEDTLLEHIQDAHAHGETVVMTNGCFDILHPGHVRYLQAARELGDWLIVAVNSDDSVQRLKGPSRPVNPLTHRMEVLAGLAAVDWVVPFSEDTPANLIAKLLPDILVKGGDYKAEEIAGYDAVTANGGQVKILDFHPGHSTTSIIETAAHSQDD
ncbi:MAG: bifunctional D-glycero-beta-D-manno-heptose-7-phosphate kinase/D-glycero-beta-D-manno-heptose 1-phosphate adenylyltransferase HldE [Salinisphaeraceae bacterium]|nr:bifunctional D-glycero-beta-D-manno-heptose-7-phosphate kinase/D-glycero-beta-D-manno-heptose 1-phosphate adenylyltransferase HldE [Salinisphaeraceae bacterium]